MPSARAAFVIWVKRRTRTPARRLLSPDSPPVAFDFELFFPAKVRVRSALLDGPHQWCRITTKPGADRDLHPTARTSLNIEKAVLGLEELYPHLADICASLMDVRPIDLGPPERRMPTERLARQALLLGGPHP